MINKINSNRGLLRLIILIIVVLFILAYFGLNLRSIVNSSTFQDNWLFVRDAAMSLWNNYLSKPFTMLWNIFVNLIWSPAIHNLEMQQGIPVGSTTVL